MSAGKGVGVGFGALAANKGAPPGKAAAAKAATAALLGARGLVRSGPARWGCVERAPRGAGACRPLLGRRSSDAALAAGNVGRLFGEKRAV